MIDEELIFTEKSIILCKTKSVIAYSLNRDGNSTLTDEDDTGAHLISLFRMDNERKIE